MKTKTLLLFTVLAQMSWAQMKISDQNGKVIKGKIDLSQRDVQIEVPVPSQLENHDIIQFTIHLKSKTGSTAEDRHGLPYSSGLQHVDYKPEALKGKKTIQLWAMKSDGTSDFSNVVYPNRTVYFNPATVMNNSKRTVQVYDLVVGVYGKDVEKYVYESDEWRNMVKTPVYKFRELAKYTIDYDGGKPADKISSPQNTIKLPKLNEDVVYLHMMSKNVKIDIPGATNGNDTFEPEDEVIVASNKSGKNHLYYKIMSVPTSSFSAEQMKELVIEKLVADANSHYNHRSFFHDDDIAYVPQLCFTYKDKANSEEKGGLKGKFNKFKQSLNTSRVTDEDIQNKIEYDKTQYTWEDAQFGRTACERLSLKVYNESELKSNSERMVYELDEEKSGDFRALDIYVAESGGHTYIAWSMK